MSSSNGNHQPTRQDPQFGFTLIEILVVLLLLGVLAGLAVPKLFQGNQEQLRQEAIRLSRVVQWTLDRGVYSGQPHRLQLDYAEQKYWVETQGENEEWEAVTEALVQKRTLQPLGIQLQPDLSRIAWQDSSLQTVEFTPFGATTALAVQLFQHTEEPESGLLVILKQETAEVSVVPWVEEGAE